jgi:hypothetical protein
MQVTSEIEARCAVDAGLTKAVFEMNEKLKVDPWDDGTLPEAADEMLPNFDSTFSYAVTGSMGSGYSVESIGKSTRAERRAYSTLLLKGVFEYALFVKGVLTLKGGTIIDGYNSTDPTITDVELEIGTNSILSDNIILNSGVVVNGSVLVGVNGVVGNVIKDLGAITEGKDSLKVEVEFPPVEAPALADMGSISVHGGTVTIGPADSGQYGQIVLKRAGQPGILEVTGGVVVLHITGDIDLGQDCEMVVKSGASLTLYLDGDLVADNNAGINNESTPPNFKLYGTGEDQQFDIKAKSDMLGAIYAPNADITIMAIGDVYGSIIARNFEMKSGGNFYYDEALKEVTVDDEAVRFVVNRWHEE